MIRKLLLLIIVVVCCRCSGFADGSDSMPAGGLQLRQTEPISIQKERLEIGESKVDTDFDFRNESNRDISTEVGFQFPSYGREANEDSTTNISNFRVWVDGQERTYETDIHAVINGKDVTSLLLTFGVDVAKLDPDTDSQKVFKILDSLADDKQDQMVALGLLDKIYLPVWHVEKRSWWTQVFPAHKVVRIHQEYRPALGYSPIKAGYMDREGPVAPEAQLEQVKDLDTQIEAACIQPGLAESLGSKTNPSAHLEMNWIDYVMTTDNSWRMPIKYFTLVIDRPKAIGAETFISLCWAGSINRPDADHLVARPLNFVPRKELHVVFLSRHKNS